MAKLFFPVSGSLRNLLAYFSNPSATDVDGVIGYQAQTVAPPYTAPKPQAALPSSKTLPSFLFRRSNCSGSGSLNAFSASSKPNCSAEILGAMSFGLALKVSFTILSSALKSMPMR